MKKVLSALIAVCCCGPLLAQQQEKKIYGGFELGSVRAADESGKLRDELVRDLGGSATVTQETSESGGRIFLGYRIDEKLAIEGGVFKIQDFNVSATGRSGAGLSYTVAGTVGTQGADLSAVYFPFATKASQDGFFLRGGAHSASVRINNTIRIGSQTASEAEKQEGWGYLFGAGYDWKISNDVFLRASATRLLKIAGESDNKATNYSIGIGMAF